jgi:SAM-dependent methyltransferase
MFASLYHKHNSLDSDDLDFWRSLAERSGGPVLELGCGTGRILLHLAQAGFTVVGLDHSAEMLTYLSSIVPDRLRKLVNYFQGDMRAYQLSWRFPLIILPCNTYSTLQSSERKQTLERASSHLVPLGTFAVSIPNPAYLRQLPQHAEADIEEVFAHPVDGEPVQVSSAWSRSKDRLTITWIYDHLLPDGTVDRLSYQVVQHILTLEIIQSEFHAAGLEILSLYGDFNLSPLSADSIYMILTAHKR